MAVLSRLAPSAHESVSSGLERLVFASIGFGSIAFSALSFGDIVTQSAFLEPWYSWITVVVAVIVPATFLVSAFIAPLGLLRVIATATALAFLVLNAAFGLAVATDGMAGGPAPWPQQLVAVSATLAATAWAPRFVWLYVAACAVSSAVVRAALHSPDSALLGVLDGANILLIATILSSIPIALRRAGSRVDQANAAALAERVNAESVRALHREQTRIDGLVHDDVLTALLYASHGVTGAPIQKLALAAIERIDGFENDPEVNPDLSPREAAAELIATAESADARASVESTVTDGEPVPSAAVAALALATAEALRNSVRYAGSGSLRWVAISAGPDRVSVSIRDDGQGFDASRVMADSVGLRVSVVERMRSVPGGSARIASRPGEGTTVELTWVRS